MSQWWGELWRRDTQVVSKEPVAESVEQLALQLEDPSGYVRERASHCCVALARPETLPLLAARLNDWVPAVRNVARAGLLSLAPVMPADALLNTLVQVARLRMTKRSDHAAWIAAYEEVVIQCAGRTALLQSISVGPRALGRACFVLARHAGYIDTATLKQLVGAAGADILLASQAIALCAQLSPTDGMEVYRSGLASPFSRVRAIALRGLLALHPDDHANLARTALNGPQAALREAAIAHLAGMGDDAARIYRGQLADEAGSARQLSIAVLGLASMGQASDLALFRQFAHHRASIVRLAALSAWLRLAGQDKDEVAALAVTDASAAVRKFALYAVARQGAYIPFDLVRESLEHIGDVALLLRFAHSGRWSCIEWDRLPKASPALSCPRGKR